MAEQDTKAPAGECIDGSDWPTRAQMHVLNAAATHGSVRVERIDGTDDMRMTTREFVAAVTPDGVRTRLAGEAMLDYDALTEVRLALARYAGRLRGTGYDRRGYDAVWLGVAAHACEVAEDAIFQALNVLSNYGDDVRAAQAIADWYARMDAPDA